MAKQRLSERMAGAAPDGLHEGVPEHLRQPIGHWLLRVWVDEQVTVSDDIWAEPTVTEVLDEERLHALAVLLRFEAQSNRTGPVEFATDLFMDANQSDEAFLDLIDGTLQIFAPDNRASSLALLLDAGHSAWTVTEDGRTLSRAVSDEAQATFNSATSVADEATKELKEAWANAFGRKGDPSDAWDHAIKAVEDVLIPAMMPTNRNATLGNVVGELAGQNGSQWKMVLPGNNQDHDVAHLVAMLLLMWPNHDRHGDTTPKRMPSAQEARAVVTLAATIVQWHREGWVVQKH
jgi:hypothetical protein